MSLERARLMGKVMRAKHLIEQGKELCEVVADTGLPESLVRDLYNLIKNN